MKIFVYQSCKELDVKIVGKIAVMRIRKHPKSENTRKCLLRRPYIDSKIATNCKTILMTKIQQIFIFVH